MRGSPPGNEPVSQSESDAPESDDSDSSSSDFEIQAVTTADGIRTETAVKETNRSEESQQPQNASEPVKRNRATASVNLTNALGLSVYSGSSSSDEDHNRKPTKRTQNPTIQPSPKQERRQKKRVRFADDPPEKRQRLECTNGQLNGPSSPLDSTVDEEAAEITVLAEFAEFEAAVADADRDIDDIEADLAGAEDAREEAKQLELEERVRRLREAVIGWKKQTKFANTNDLERGELFKFG